MSVINARAISRFGYAVIFSSIAILLDLLLYPKVATDPWLFFSISVALSFWVGDAVSGLFAVFLAILATDLFFLPPPNSLGLREQEWPALFAFIIRSLMVGFLIILYHRSERTNRRFSAIVESADDAIISVTLEGVITSWNAGAERIYGYAVSEVAGRSLEILYPPGKSNELDQTLQRVRRGEKIDYVSVQRVRKDGRRINVVAQWSAIKDANRKIIGASIIARDITDQTRAQQLLTQLSTAIEQSADDVCITDRDGYIQYVNPSFERHTGYSKTEVLGRNPRILKSGRHPVDYYERLWATVLAGQPFRGEMVNRKKDGEMYYEEKTITPITDSSGNITHFVSTGKDITERVLAQQTLELQIAARTRELTALYELTSVVSRSFDENVILEQALAQTMAAVDARIGGIWLIDPSTRQLRLACSRGWTPEMTAQAVSRPTPPGIATWVLTLDQPRIIPDVAQDHHTAEWASAIGHMTGAVAPIRAKVPLFGMIAVLHDLEIPFNHQQLKLVGMVGEHLEVALENAHLYHLAQNAAAEKERERMAFELHDSITQSLYSMVLMADSARRFSAQGDTAHETQYLVRLSEVARQSLKEIRLTLYELRPPVLAQVGLVQALEQRVHSVETRTGIDARVFVTGSITIPSLAEEVLYRVALEALNNSLRHAQATSTRVILRPFDHSVELEVNDNGKGFDPEAQESGGLGLLSMRQRVEQLGGSLKIMSKPGAGARVIAIVPTGSA